MRGRALITNDDGIDSPGLWALAAAVDAAGFEVTVAAPHVDASGVGGSLQAVRDGGRVRVHPRDSADLPGVNGWAVEGHPAYIVSSAVRGWLPTPDVVFSGINVGANIGRLVLHSGTVGAALTAGLHGVRALAVSIDSPWAPVREPFWASATAVLPEAIDLLLDSPEATVLSLNVPDLPIAEIGGLREATLARYGRVQVRTDRRVDGENHHLESTFAPSPHQAEPGTDAALLAAGHATVTRLRTISDVPGIAGVGTADAGRQDGRSG